MKIPVILSVLEDIDSSIESKLAMSFLHSQQHGLCSSILCYKSIQSELSSFFQCLAEKLSSPCSFSNLKQYMWMFGIIDSQSVLSRSILIDFWNSFVLWIARLAKKLKVHCPTSFSFQVNRKLACLVFSFDCLVKFLWINTWIPCFIIKFL